MRHQHQPNYELNRLAWEQHKEAQRMVVLALLVMLNVALLTLCVCVYRDKLATAWELASYLWTSWIH